MTLSRSSTAPLRASLFLCHCLFNNTIGCCVSAYLTTGDTLSLSLSLSLSHTHTHTHTHTQTHTHTHTWIATGYFSSSAFRTAA